MQLIYNKLKSKPRNLQNFIDNKENQLVYTSPSLLDEIKYMCFSEDDVVYHNDERWKKSSIIALKSLEINYLAIRKEDNKKDFSSKIITIKNLKIKDLIVMKEDYDFINDYIPDINMLYIFLTCPLILVLENGTEIWAELVFHIPELTKNGYDLERDFKRDVCTHRLVDFEINEATRKNILLGDRVMTILVDKNDEFCPYMIDTIRLKEDLKKIKPIKSKLDNEKKYTTTVELTFEDFSIPPIGSSVQFLLLVYNNFENCIHKAKVMGYCNSTIEN